MGGQGDILVRIEEVEAELRGLSREVHELRLLATSAPAVRATSAVAPPSPAEQERPSAAPTTVRRPPERVTSAAPTPPAAASPAPPVPAPPSSPGRTIADLARDWDLLGPRGFAVVGGGVTALGVILLFVLAANRGWITPGMRVAFGAVVSASAVGAGFWVRRRYGQMLTSVGAVGAGIAGGYASLAAATAHFDLVPDWLALPLAGLIAVVAVLIALAWDSEIVAGIGLLGSALAPGLQALDSGLEWVSVAFAVIVLAGTVALSVPRSWHRLLIAIAAVVTAQAAWLAAVSERSADAGTTAVEASLVLLLLAAGIWLQLRSGAIELDRLATAFVLAPVGLTLGFAQLLYADGRGLGIALAVAAAVWAAAWAALRRLHQPDLALVLGVSSLTLAAVASVYFVTGTSLAVAWATQSLLFSALAWRLRDARLQLMSLAYLALSAAYVSLVDVPPWTIFADPVAGAAAISVAALALAAAVAGLLAPPETAQRTEAGLLAWIAPLRGGLGRHREGLREALVFAGAATGTYALALAFVSISFRPGHLAATIVASAVGAIVPAVAARRGSACLVAAGVAWLSGVLIIAAAFDVPEFANEAVNRSYGGWALIAAAAGLLAGCYACQLLFPDPSAPVLAAVAGVVALATSAAGIALISPPGDVLTSSWIGWRLVIPALVYFGLAARVFRSERHRDLSTCLWALGTGALLAAETLVVDGATWTVIA